MTPETSEGFEALRKMLFLPPEASSFAAEFDTLHFVVIGCTMIGAFGVAIWTAYLMVRWARKREDEATPHVRSGPWMSVMKVAGPLSLFLVFWVFGFRRYVRMQQAPEGSFDVYVTAKQWMWKFAYPNGPTSVSTLTVPVGRPVRLVLTSRDVIHSFFVPAFRVKQDVIPGRFVTLWFQVDQPGTYDIYCAEFCGTSHSGMRGAVVALSEEDFAKWLESQPPGGAPAVDDEKGGALASAPGSMAAYGAEIARRKQCLGCHSVTGQTLTGPSWRGLYLSNVTLSDGRTVLADEGYLTRSMMDPAVDVVAGYQPVMPVYRGQLEAPEAAALVEYIKSLRFAAPPPPVPLPAIGPLAAGDAGATEVGRPPSEEIPDASIPSYAPGLVEDASALPGPRPPEISDAMTTVEQDAGGDR